jgi:enediyne polyketide synthase
LSTPIAIVGMACRYPDAASPSELWENVLAQRQAFRRIPDERLPLADYWSPDPHAPDRTYSAHAALLTDWTFDRAVFRISASTYEATDPAHWLALEVSASAIADAGVALPAARTAVIVGNTLTGDGSRAAAMRLRWPYVRRAAEVVLAGRDDRETLLHELERRFKEPFAEITEDSLTGGLSNTIAGRICNAFGFGGGGYVIDGACSSSLLAIAQACSALAAGDVDAVVAGGVDLSIDPFELIGFAKCTALARERMWVYDRKANGFLPGEGCGFVVLMRYEDALRAGARIDGTIAGWGISSDGHGGMTRPEACGQRLALLRAWERAAMPVSSAMYFEGHGTGTPVGDPIEIETIASLLDGGAHFIGSVKANIGHTKAAAGIAGLIKATLAVHHGAIPPATACDEPRDELISGPLRVAAEPLPWPANGPRRAGVSAFGFGGINAHIVVESHRTPQARRGENWSAGRQDAEVFLFGGATRDDVMRQVGEVADRAPSLSLAEMTDLAVALRCRLGATDHRAAVVASTPEELVAALRGATVFAASSTPRIAFLFSGQASPVVSSAGAWARRFPELALDALFPATTRDAAGTALAQPAIVAASVAALRALRHLGIEASCAAGHSLGEISAMHWGRAMTAEEAVDLATFRGDVMQRLAGDGAMAALGCDAETAAALCVDGVVVAARNTASQTVVSGRAAAVDAVVAVARARGITATILPVAAAFHSSAMAPAAEPLRQKTAAMAMRPLQRRVFSTVTGDWLDADADLTSLLERQLTSPVLFHDAVQSLAEEADLIIEVGPGRVLAQLADGVSTDIGTASLRGLLQCAGTAWARGCEVDLDALFRGRFARPFDFARRPSFITSPCERRTVAAEPKAPAPREPAARAAAGDVLRELVASHVQLPLELVAAESRLLSDLHLSSITVARLLGEAARALGTPPLLDPTALANATIADAAAALEALRAEAAPGHEIIDGIEPWVRAFRVVDVPAPIQARQPVSESSWRFAGASWPEAEARFGDVAGRGVVFVAPSDDDACIDELLDLARGLRDGDRALFVQDRPRIAAFARTLFLERPRSSVRIVNVQRFDMQAIEEIAAEAEAAGDFCEATYRDGQRFEPRVEVMPTADGGDAPLGPSDLVLVTGGGRGIGLEIAFHLARRSGARLLILGRSPNADLALLDDAGIRYLYLQADVTRPLELPPGITAVIHAAGVNEPALIEALDAAAVRETIGPKVAGLRNVLAAIDASRLRLLFTFGSVIASTGMRGEAHYALANDWLARDTAVFAAAHPECRALCIEWSVWSGTGMGERAGAIEMLRRQGVMPLGIDDALAVADRLLAGPSPARVIVAGRLGNAPTIRFAGDEPPLLRFIDMPRAFTPGVEIVADASLSLRNDPYLADHVFGGEPLLPAVVGLEAMAQAAFAAGGETSTRVENVELRRPVSVARDGLSDVRVAALVRDDRIDAALRAAESQFRFDHFRASFTRRAAGAPDRIALSNSVVAVDPVKDVYQPLLFHTGRFRRVRRYRVLRAAECVADVDAGNGEPWFLRYLPAAMVLGDPGARDAAIHALQACVPQMVVLPVAIRSIDLFAPITGAVVVRARETARAAEEFTWDLDIATAAGEVLERWSGLRLRAVARRMSLDGLAPALWGPYLEREIGAGALRVVATPHDGADALRDVCGTVPLRRADGRPIRRDDGYVSASHGGGVTLAVADDDPVGCDLQIADGHPWRDILAAGDAALADLCVRSADDPFPLAAARVWAARESIKKAGVDVLASLTLGTCSAQRHVSFGAGATTIDTFVIGGCIAAIAHRERNTS